MFIFLIKHAFQNFDYARTFLQKDMKNFHKVRYVSKFFGCLNFLIVAFDIFKII